MKRFVLETHEGSPWIVVYDTPQTLKPRLIAACVSEETAAIWEEHQQMLLSMAADRKGINGSA